MNKFSALMPVGDEDVRSLTGRMSQVKLGEAEKRVLRALFEGGCAYGAGVRKSQDNDGLALGTLARLEYENGVDVILSASALAGYRPLAQDLALVAYNEAHRCQTNSPSSLEPIKALLAA